MDTIRNSNIALTSAGIAITAAAAVTAKTVNAFNPKIDGNIGASVAAATLPVLTGINVATGFTTPILVTCNIAGTFALTAGTSVSTALITTGIFPTSGLPQVSGQGSAIVGYIIIKNATGSLFTGNTTALDTASLTVTYINVAGLGALANS